MPYRLNNQKMQSARKTERERVGVSWRQRQMERDRVREAGSRARPKPKPKPRPKRRPVTQNTDSRQTSSRGWGTIQAWWIYRLHRLSTFTHAWGNYRHCLLLYSCA